MFKLSHRSLTKLNGIRPELITLAVLGIKDTPYDYGITNGIRTREEQEYIYAQGRSRAGKVVTWTMESKHLIQPDGFGHAFDFGVWVGGKLTWEEYYYDAVGEHLNHLAAQLDIPILWGGKFKRRKDRPHVEFAG